MSQDGSSSTAAAAAINGNGAITTTAAHSFNGDGPPFHSVVGTQKQSLSTSSIHLHQWSDPTTGIGSQAAKGGESVAFFERETMAGTRWFGVLVAVIDRQSGFGTQKSVALLHYCTIHTTTKLFYNAIGSRHCCSCWSSGIGIARQPCIVFRVVVEQFSRFLGSSKKKLAKSCRFQHQSTQLMFPQLSKGVESKKAVTSRSSTQLEFHL